MAQANSKVNVIVSAIDQASAKFGRIGTAANRMGGMIKGALIGAGVYLSARAIKDFVTSSVAEFNKQAVASQKLESALRLLGEQAQLPEMTDFANQLQRVTTIADDTAMEIMALGSSMGRLSGQALRDATLAAIGLSKAYGIELVAAMRLVSRAAVGDTAQLRRYGIVLEDGLSAQEKFNEVLKLGARNFQLAADETSTYAGQLAQLSNQWGDLKESIGQAVAAAFGRVMPAIKSAITLLQVFAENWSTTWQLIVTSASLRLAQVWGLIKWYYGTVIPSLLQWFGRNWFDVFVDIGAATAKIIVNMWENLKSFFANVWKWLRGEETDWQWKGLLDGFESTLKELPKIAAREIGPLERQLQDEMDRLGGVLGGKLAEKLADSVKLGASGGAAAVANAAADGGSASKAPGALSARFLTYAPGAKFGGVDAAEQTKRNTADSAKSQKEAVSLAKKQLAVGQQMLDELRNKFTQAAAMDLAAANLG